MNVVKLIVPYTLPVSFEDCDEWSSFFIHEEDCSFYEWDLRYESWCNMDLLCEKGIDTKRNLERLKDLGSFKCIADFEAYIEGLIIGLAEINDDIRDFEFNLVSGIRHVNLEGLSTLEKLYARVEVEDLFSKYMRKIIQMQIDDDVIPNWIITRIYDTASFYNSLVCIRIIKELFPKVHVSVMGSNFETFSLEAMLKNNNSGFYKWVDEIIEGKEIHKQLLEIKNNLRGSVKESNKGFISQEQYLHSRNSKYYNSVFSVHMKLSEEPCYWGKCKFCVHNFGDRESKKYNEQEIINRIKTLADAGVAYIVFFDEAVNYSRALSLARCIIERNIKIIWSFRTRIDQKINQEEMRLLYESGCKEITFGLECIDNRTLSLYSKYADPIDQIQIQELIQQFNDIGIAVHLNMIIGFPNECAEQISLKDDFLLSILKSNRYENTITLNQFQLFKNSYVADHPDLFDIELLEKGSEIDNRVLYRECKISKDAINKKKAALMKIRINMSEALGFNPKYFTANFIYNNSVLGCALRMKWR